MGMEKYEMFVRRADSTLTYDPGWSRENKTGSWRTSTPVFQRDLCTDCQLCWLFCPEGCIERSSYRVDYDYCKGCGICAAECRPGAMAMRDGGEAP